VTDGRFVSGSLLALTGVWCHYGPTPVLEELSLHIDAGDFTGIVGPSGSGKTTLLRALLGIVHPTRGTLTRQPDLRVGYVPQVETINWSFPVTVAEVVLMARVKGRLAPWPSSQEKREVAEVLERLGIGDLQNRHIRELSGGQQQRVFIARALLGRPQLLLMDEPTSGVDVRTRHDVLHLLSDLNDDGLAVVVTTHDLNGIAAHLPYLICLNRVITGSGTPTEVLRSDVLEATYGASLEVLQHAGMPLVVDGFNRNADVVPLRASPVHERRKEA